jgi:hypothetical protein
VPANKKGGPLKIIVPKAKPGIKRPSAVELALAKPVKQTKKFVLDSLSAPLSGLGDAGASSSQAPAATAKKVVASPVESQESSPHDPMLKTLEEALAIA